MLLVKTKRNPAKMGRMGQGPKVRLPHPGANFKIPGTSVRYWLDMAQMNELFSLLELEDYDAVRECLQDIKSTQKIPWIKEEAVNLLGPGAALLPRMTRRQNKEVKNG